MLLKGISRESFERAAPTGELFRAVDCVGGAQVTGDVAKSGIRQQVVEIDEAAARAKRHGFDRGQGSGEAGRIVGSNGFDVLHVQRTRVDEDLDSALPEAADRCAEKFERRDVGANAAQRRAESLLDAFARQSRSPAAIGELEVEVCEDIHREPLLGLTPEARTEPTCQPTPRDPELRLPRRQVAPRSQASRLDHGDVAEQTVCGQADPFEWKPDCLRQARRAQQSPEPWAGECIAPPLGQGCQVDGQDDLVGPRIRDAIGHEVKIERPHPGRGQGMDTDPARVRHELVDLLLEACGKLLRQRVADDHRVAQVPHLPAVLLVAGLAERCKTGIELVHEV